MERMTMYDMGPIQYAEQQEDRITCPECDAEGGDHCGGKGYHILNSGSYKTPEGNEVEMAEVQVEVEEADV